LCSLALLSHVGIFPLLVAILLATAVLFRVAGGPPLRPAAGAITAITLLAIVFSVAVYYGHFPESYETLHRVVGSAEPAAASPGPDVPLSRVPPLRAPTRVLRAADVGVRAFGWPIVLLAGVGAWRVWCRGARDRVTLLIAATAVAYVVFAGFAAVMPVEPRFQRYMEEFIGRVNYTAMPAAVILAACGAAWMWARGVTGRTVLVVLFTWAVLLAGGRWAADILRRG
jgi:hypothetical protein